MGHLVTPPVGEGIRTLLKFGMKTNTPKPSCDAFKMKGSIVPTCKPFSMHRLRLQIPGIVPELGIRRRRLSQDKHPFVANMEDRGQSSQSTVNGTAICSKPRSLTIFICTYNSPCRKGIRSSLSHSPIERDRRIMCSSSHILRSSRF